MAEGAGNAPASTRADPVFGTGAASLDLPAFRGLADPMGLAPTAFPQTTGCSAHLSYGSNWWSRRVTLPHGPACRAGALLVCHDPKVASRSGAAPDRQSFGDSTARWCPACLEIGAAAGNRTRTFSLARRRSAAKPQPRKLKGPGARCPHSRPAPFQQRSNTTW